MKGCDAARPNGRRIGEPDHVLERIAGSVRHAFDGVWSPDLRLGVARHEAEAYLTKLHFVVRTAIITTHGIRLLASPSDIRRRDRAAAALAVNATAMGAMWWRSQTWHNLHDPRIRMIERVAGGLETSLAISASTPQALRQPASWMYRMYAPRIGPSASFSETPWQFLGHLMISATPMLATRNGRRRRPLLALAVAGIPPALAGIIIARSVRDIGDDIDRAIEEKSHNAQAIIAERETERFFHDVLRPACDRLATLSALLASDPDEAKSFATDVEAWVRRWLDDHELEYDPRDVRLPEMAGDDLFHIVQANRSRTQSRARAYYSSGVAIEALMRKRPHRSGLRAFAAFHFIDAIGAAIEAHTNDGTPERREATERLRTALDWTRIGATTWYLAGDPTDALTQNHVNRSTHHVVTNVTVGGRRASRVSSLLGAALRIGIGATKNTTRKARVNAVGIEIAMAAADAAANAILLHNLRTSADNVAQGTAAFREPLARALLNRLHTAHTALIHDGVAQVLGAVIAGTIAPEQLIEWIEVERNRLAVVLQHRTLSEANDAPSLTDVLTRVGDQFRARALDVTVVAPDLGPELLHLADPLARIVRETLSNVAKHSLTRRARCHAFVIDHTLILSIASDSAPPLGAEMGTGLRTILRTAEEIGASAQWIGRETDQPTFQLIVPLEPEPAEIDLRSLDAAPAAVRNATPPGGVSA